MRKFVVLALAAGLIAGALGSPVSAARKKTKPQPVTFYLHGPFPAGEIDYVETTANTLQAIPDGFQPMDTTEPSDPTPDSMGLTNYVRGPNTECMGNGLFPTWTGDIAGRVTGDMKVYLNAVTAAATVDVDVFTDTTGIRCNSEATGAADYQEPVATTTVELTPGVEETEVILKGVDFSAGLNMVIMVTPASAAVGGEPVNDPGTQGRILYDSADYASRIEFQCTPTKGKTCVPAS